MGSTYYGIMEMSGNVWELCVTVDFIGLLYNGLEGDGELSANGEANVASWPTINGQGAGYRGGAFNSGTDPAFRDPAISSRFYAGLAPNLRRNTSGGRGVRGK